MGMADFGLVGSSLGRIGSSTNSSMGQFQKISAFFIVVTFVIVSTLNTYGLGLWATITATLSQRAEIRTLEEYLEKEKAIQDSQNNKCERFAPTQDFNG